MSIDFGGTGQKTTKLTQYFRDPAAWYHVMLVFDTSSATTTITGSATDLLVVVSARSTSTNGDFTMTFNNSATGYSTRRLAGNGSTPSSTTDDYGSAELYAGNALPSSYTASTFGNGTIYIPNYAGSTNKSVSIDSVGENSATASPQNLIAGLWANTSAITSIKLVKKGASNLFAQYSTASLYIITKGSGGATVS